MKRSQDISQKAKLADILRQQIVAHVLAIDPTAAVSDDTEIIKTLRRLYVLGQARRSPAGLYPQILEGIHQRRQEPNPTYSGIKAEPRTAHLDKRKPLNLASSPSMRLAMERAQAAQPRCLSISSNAQPTWKDL